MFATATSIATPGAGSHDWLDQLNPEQRVAATHAGGPLLILAGAGTGKTTTLCGRVAWLLSEGVAPERILLLTFTRRAAREMLQRTQALLRGLDGSRKVLGGTFHSVAHRFIRIHAASLGLTAGFAVLDAGDAADLLDLIREEHGHAQSERRFPRKSTLLDIYSRTVNCQEQLSDVVAEAFPWCEDHVDAMAMLFKAYTARKRSLGVLDLEDLLLYWRALASDDVVGRAIEDGFDHVLIDEYQDVNGLQVEIVRSLRSRSRELTAVGDDLQSIYGWRSASAEHILRFPQQFDGTTVVKLERNYRSSQPILDTANAIAAQAERTYGKSLVSEVHDGAPPQLVFVRDDSAQAAEVCRRVLETREHGVELRRQAVLMRTSHDSDLLELELARRQIPFVKYGGLRYLEAAHVKDLIALFRLVGNPQNELAWFRVLQLLEGVGPVIARRVSDALVTGGAGLEGWGGAREHLPASARGPADTVLAALARGEGAAGTQAECLRDAIAPLIKARYPDGVLRLGDLDQLVAAARAAPDLAHFAAELALDPPLSSSDLAGAPHLDEDYLVLSTIHSAKGLEWDAVHVLALYDGNFPACMSAGTSESIDEERRLLYVAVTRARRQLHLYVPVRYYHRPHGIDDAHGYGKPSRFLTEAVRRTCAVVRLGDSDLAAPAHRRGPPRKISVSVDALFS
ncbi:MAG: ATP-dependent helicase [Solirubrobacterales bacterium]|nr:ATP-dependent helicase [Solirubrobacterales bacterium]